MTKSKTNKRDVITFLTWNICLMENSAQAPAGWRMDQAESKIREHILELDPDFVFFQELPGLVPYVETHDLIPANTTSHSGNIATIVKKDLMDELESKAIGGVAVLTAFKSAGITFANVHLEPSRNGDHKRFASIERIVQTCETPGLLIAGDTNTRTSEEESLEKLGLVGKRPPTATWNSRENLYRDGGRKYTAYYTRHFHNENVKVSSVKVWNEPLEVDGKKFHLSDHYSMSGKISLQLSKP